MTDKKLQELIEEEVALQRWIGEGGSSGDPFGVMAIIETQLECHRKAGTTSYGRANDELFDRSSHAAGHEDDEVAVRRPKRGR